MEFLPIFLALAGRPALVVGGGEVAGRKAALLRSAGAAVTVVAPRLGRGLADLSAEGVIEHRARCFRESDLEGMALAIAATDDRAVNQAVAAAAGARALPVNVVDDPALCSFIMPAIVDRGAVVAAVSTGGLSPVLARLLRTRLELALPAELERAAAIAADWREPVRQRLPAAGPRRRFWERALAHVLAGGTPSLETLLAEVLDPPPPATILVDPADPDAITLRDLKRLQAADLVLHEPRVPAALLGYARRDAIVSPIEGPAEREAMGEGATVVVLRCREP